jgi:hypothetical protein
LLASNWTAVTAAPGAVGTMMLLTDGTVIGQQAGVTNTWFKLTPNSSGSYSSGTWSTIATMNLQRLYFGSNVLQNGNVFVVGGEYSGASGTANWTNTGEIYNSATNTWSNITNFPNTQFGDDPTILLPNGNVLAGYLSGPQTYIYNITNNTWSQTGTKLNNDASDEETWVKLPDDSILSYNVFTNLGTTPGAAQRYIPSSGTWVATGPVPVSLSSSAVGEELGPGAVLPNGKVLQLGGNSNSALYDPATNSWTTGPVIPGGRACDDAPGVLLPNGQFLFAADTPLFHSPTHVFDYDYVSNTITDVTPTTANGDPADLVNQLAGLPSFTGRFLMLPNGQALYTAGGNANLYVYTPTGSVTASSVPTITSFTSNGGNSYTLNGTQLSGASQGASYGDDCEMDTNYPIVSLVNGSTVTYGRTTNWNKTGIGLTNGATTTNFTLPVALLLPPVVTPVAPTATEGTALTNVPVATFTDPNGNHTGSYTALITWGDGAQTAGVVTGPDAGGKYTVSGTHTYAEEGPVTLSVAVTDTYTSLNVSANGISSAPDFYANATGSSSITVGDPSVVGIGGFVFNTTVGVSTGTVTVATFTDPAGAEALANYSASIDWGDAGTSTGTITGPVAGVFTVTGSHTYTTVNTFNIKVTISHETSTPVVVNDTANVANSTSAVTNVTSTTPNGVYGLNKTVLVDVTFNAVETVSGVPQIALNSGGTANYTSGSGTNTLVFTYVVGAGQNSAHLDYTSTSALTLNGGTINGPGNIPANLTLPAPGAAGSLSANTNIVIDTVAPTVLHFNLLFGTSGSYDLIGSNRVDVPWTITGIQVVFSKPITTADQNSFSGLTTTGFAGLGTNTLTWTITPISVGVFNTNLLGSGADGITDAAGNFLGGGTGFAQGLTVLLGDWNGDKSVTSADMSGVNVGRSQTYNIFADINGDGVVDTTDVQTVRAHLGSSLP